MSLFLDIKNIKKSYDGRLVLSIDELLIEAASIIAITGSNGSGKTTLLNLLSTLLLVDEGSICIAGRDITDRSLITDDFRKTITLVQQNPYMYNASVQWNVGLGLRIRGVRELDAKVSEILIDLGLEGYEKRNALELSAGEKQRVAIARGLIIKPALLLLDEPIAHVDQKHGCFVKRAIEKVRQEEGTTVVFTTHSKAFASELADKIILDMGRK